MEQVVLMLHLLWPGGGDKVQVLWRHLPGYQLMHGEIALCSPLPHLPHVQGPRVASRQCLPAKCVGTTSALTSSSLDPSPSPPPRPTPVYGASPCACGCTYLLHSSREEDTTSRDINIVSGNNTWSRDPQPNLFSQESARAFLSAGR